MRKSKRTVIMAAMLLLTVLLCGCAGTAMAGTEEARDDDQLQISLSLEESMTEQGTYCVRAWEDFVLTMYMEGAVRYELYRQDKCVDSYSGETYHNAHVEVDAGINEIYGIAYVPDPESGGETQIKSRKLTVRGTVDTGEELRGIADVPDTYMIGSAEPLTFTVYDIEENGEYWRISLKVEDENGHDEEVWAAGSEEGTELGEPAESYTFTIGNELLEAGRTYILTGVIHAVGYYRYTRDFFIRVEEMWVYGDGGLTVTEYCGSETEVTIPEGVTKLGFSLFEDNETITVVHVPESVTALGDSVFKNAHNLRELYLPDHITEMGTEVFVGTWYKRIYAHIDSDTARLLAVPSIAEKVRDGLWQLGYTEDRQGIMVYDWMGEGEELEFPAKFGEAPVTYLSLLDAFSANDKQLKRVFIPDSVTQIEWNPYTNCAPEITVISWPDAYACRWAMEDAYQEVPWMNWADTLEMSVLPEDLTEIQEYAFENADFEAVTIPASCARIGHGAFAGCKRLKLVRMPADTVYEADAFEDGVIIERTE